METTVDLSWLCIVIPIGIIAVAALLGTRSRLKYAQRIRDAQARGAFADINTPKNKSRFRRFAFLALIGTLGLMVSLVMLIQPWINLRVPLGAFIAAFIVFGIMGSVGGYLMQSEINRRL